MELKENHAIEGPILLCSIFYCECVYSLQLNLKESDLPEIHQENEKDVMLTCVPFYDTVKCSLIHCSR